MVRVFIGLDLTDEVREAVADLQGRLRRAPVGVKVSWVKASNLHLTLQFLGYVPEEKIPLISASLGRVCAGQEVFEVQVGGAGAFPDVRCPRVIWLGCSDPSGGLQRLAEAVHAEMKQLGFVSERRGFVPHLTLGRIRAPAFDAALTKLLNSLRDCQCGTVRVEAVHLFESQLNPQGSIYRKLSSHPLKGVVRHGSES
ncbi:MAG: RNA 2',3'-cyclic phosphodiesterase [Verrucomicrobiae bacterium]|nr:RNA 2',3'-cyclic phosphodiesterase [Verrucomicrobiae bacterium]